MHRSRKWKNAKSLPQPIWKSRHAPKSQLVLLLPILLRLGVIPPSYADVAQYKERRLRRLRALQGFWGQHPILAQRLLSGAEFGECPLPFLLSLLVVISCVIATAMGHIFLVPPLGMGSILVYLFTLLLFGTIHDKMEKIAPAVSHLGWFELEIGETGFDDGLPLKTFELQQRIRAAIPKEARARLKFRVDTLYYRRDCHDCFLVVILEGPIPEQWIIDHWANMHKRYQKLIWESITKRQPHKSIPLRKLPELRFAVD